MTNLQRVLLFVLRFALGWHLFYQGFGKLIAVRWSSVGYLNLSPWPVFKWLAASPVLLWLADVTTIWALIIVGLLLMVGLFTELAAVAGALLLLLIYGALPPLDYTGFVMSTQQGSELYVDKTLIEVFALFIVAVFRAGQIWGFDILVKEWRRRQ